MEQIPDEFIKKLKAQVAQQFESIVRYRKLKNDAIDEGQRRSNEVEIQRCIKNIDEIRQSFLAQARGAEVNLSNAAVYQKTQEVVKQVGKVIGDKNVINLGDVVNQINNSHIGTLNIYHYHAPPPLTSKNVVTYYEATNQSNYQGVILNDPKGMRLDQIYVEPIFAEYNS